jgi:hypothetical protein
MLLTTTELTPFTLKGDEIIPGKMLDDFYEHVKYWIERRLHNMPDVKREVVDVAQFKVLGTKLGEEEIEFDDIEYKAGFLKRFDKYCKHVWGDAYNDYVEQSVKYRFNMLCNEYILKDDVTGFYEFYYDVDWIPGTYGEDEGSCWWSYQSYSRGRMDFRLACSEKRACVLRLYDANKKPMGRCFVIYAYSNDEYEENDGKDACIFFNAYHHTIGAVYPLFRKLFAHIMGAEYNVQRVNTLSIHPGGANMYNNGLTYVVSKSAEKRINIDIDDFDEYDYSNRAWNDERERFIGNWDEEDDYDDDYDYDEDEDEY